MRKWFEGYFRKKWEIERKDKQFYAFYDAYRATQNPELRSMLQSILASLADDKPIFIEELELCMKQSGMRQSAKKSSGPRRLTVVKKGKK